MQQYSNASGQSYDDWYERGQARVRNIAIGIVAAIVVGGAVGGLLWWHARTHPPIVPAPALGSYTSPDKNFQVAQPLGWAMDASSSEGLNSGVTFSKGLCKMDVSADFGGSLMGDIATAQNSQAENIASQAGLPPPQTTPPVEKLHAAGKQQMANEYPGYVEQPMQMFRCKAGDARVSEFTSETGGSNPIDHLHGYRATILSNQREIAVVEVCPEQNWAILKPVYQKVLESVAMGQ